MSDAWTWRHAVCQSELSANAKHVLMTLSLWMNEKGGSCYPKQAELVAYCSRDPKTVRAGISEASKAGWLKVDKHGFRGQKWKRLEYQAMWPGRGLEGDEPEPEASDDGAKGGGTTPPPCDKKVGEPLPKGGGTTPPKVGEPLPQDKNIPDNFPESLHRAGAREGGADAPVREVDLKKREKEIENAFWRIVKEWPGNQGMPKQRALEAFRKLTDDERKMAEERRDNWFAVLKQQKKTHTPAPTTYFGEKLFLDISAGGDAKPSLTVVKPFGKAWFALRLRMLKAPRKPWNPSPLQQHMRTNGKGHLVVGDRRRAQFPQVAMLDRDALDGREWSVPPDVMLPDLDGYERIAAGGEEWDAWQAWFDANDWPLLPMPPGRDRWVWVPSRLPAEQESANARAKRGEADVESDSPCTENETLTEADIAALGGGL